MNFKELGGEFVILEKFKGQQQFQKFKGQSIISKKFRGQLIILDN